MSVLFCSGVGFFLACASFESMTFCLCCCALICPRGLSSVGVSSALDAQIEAVRRGLFGKSVESLDDRLSTQIVQAGRRQERRKETIVLRVGRATNLTPLGDLWLPCRLL